VIMKEWMEQLRKEFPGLKVRSDVPYAELTTLGTFPFEHVWMTTIVIIGNSATIVRDGRFYCRRGYREKHEFEA